MLLKLIIMVWNSLFIYCTSKVVQHNEHILVFIVELQIRIRHHLSMNYYE